MKRGPLVAALVGAAVVLLLVVGLVLPKANQVRTREKEVADARQSESTLRLQLDQLEGAALGAAAARARLEALEAEVPPTADLPGLIRLVNTAATDSDVSFVSIAPGSPAASTGGVLSTIPAQITVIGEFFAVDRFLFRLESMPRAAKVTSINVTGGPAGGDSLQVVLSTEFYTTDTNAGPGSLPGPSGPSVGDLFDESGDPVPAPSVAPSATPGG